MQQLLQPSGLLPNPVLPVHHNHLLCHILGLLLEKNQVVQSVLVKKGDKVKVGTPLIAYDTTALKLAVQEKKNAVDAAEDDLRQARKELERLQSLHPAEDQVYDIC